MPKILVIDDEPDFIKLMEKALVKDGYEVLSATNGVEGITIAEAERPDLILLDVFMPTFGGRKVLRHLRDTETTAHIPIVVVTAASEDTRDAIQTMEGAAPDALFPKPFNMDDLLASINSLLDTPAD